MLRRLLTAGSEEEKQVINNITSCIKFIHQNCDIEWFRMNRVYQTILKEFKGGQSEPTHVPEDFFIRIASVILKLPHLPGTRLYEKLRFCLVERNMGEGGAIEEAAEERPELVSMKNLKLLVDLYQFLPSKKNPQGELNTFTSQGGRPAKTRNDLYK